MIKYQETKEVPHPEEELGHTTRCHEQEYFQSF